MKMINLGNVFSVIVLIILAIVYFSFEQRSKKITAGFVFCFILVLSLGFYFSVDWQVREIKKATTIEAVDNLLTEFEKGANKKRITQLREFCYQQRIEISHSEAERLKKTEPKDLKTWQRIHFLAKPETPLEGYADTKVKQLKQDEADRLAETADNIESWKKVRKLAVYGTESYEKADKWIKNYWHAKAQEQANKAKTAKDWYSAYRNARAGSELKAKCQSTFFQAQAKELSELSEKDIYLLMRDQSGDLSNEELENMPKIDYYTIRQFNRLLVKIFGDFR